MKKSNFEELQIKMIHDDEYSKPRQQDTIFSLFVSFYKRYKKRKYLIRKRKRIVNMNFPILWKYNYGSLK